MIVSEGVGLTTSIRYWIPLTVVLGSTLFLACIRQADESRLDSSTPSLNLDKIDSCLPTQLVFDAKTYQLDGITNVNKNEFAARLIDDSGKESDSYVAKIIVNQNKEQAYAKALDKVKLSENLGPDVFIKSDFVSFRGVKSGSRTYYVSTTIQNKFKGFSLSDILSKKDDAMAMFQSPEMIQKAMDRYVAFREELAKKIVDLTKKDIYLANLQDSNIKYNGDQWILLDAAVLTQRGDFQNYISALAENTANLESVIKLVGDPNQTLSPEDSLKLLDAQIGEVSAFKKIVDEFTGVPLGQGIDAGTGPIEESLSLAMRQSVNEEQISIDRLLKETRIEENVTKNTDGSGFLKRIITRDPLSNNVAKVGPYRLIELHYRAGEKYPFRRILKIANQLIIKSPDGLEFSEITEKLSNLGLAIKEKLGRDFLLVEFQDPKLAKIESLKQTLSANSFGFPENNALIFGASAPNKEDYVNQWELYDVSPNKTDNYSILVDDLWRYQTNCRPVGVALLDFDFDTGHEVFKYQEGNKIKSNMSDEVLSKGRDQVSEGEKNASNTSADANQSASDASRKYQGHALSIAAIIGASPEGKPITGMCNRARIYSLPVMDSSIGHGTTGELLSKLVLVDENTDKIGVLNLSFETSAYSRWIQLVLSDLDKKGVIIVAAAGNSGIEIEKLEGESNAEESENFVYPASYSLDNLIVVGSATSYKTLSSFSNFGGAVDLAAPGQGLYSLMMGQSYFTGVDDNDSQEQSVMPIDSGSSYAAAFVTGAVTLAKSHNPSISGRGLREVLAHSSRPKTADDKAIVLLNLYGLGSSIVASSMEASQNPDLAIDESHSCKLSQKKLAKILATKQSENEIDCTSFCNTAGPMLFEARDEIECKFNDKMILSFKQRLP